MTDSKHEARLWQTWGPDIPLKDPNYPEKLQRALEWLAYAHVDSRTARRVESPPVHDRIEQERVHYPPVISP